MRQRNGAVRSPADTGRASTGSMVILRSISAGQLGASCACGQYVFAGSNDGGGSDE